ncbi:UNKNOWN [Stylonychia lemnae]|uniref:Uncharacterized protein n=1 Tax=Stylonychia lemnae TaxID=5949 RepID=A0A077ZNW6_STYLE|nr:UNKNOWN [Stylonychia lemnae]|eukprot:CDW71657.1 UNKNOWN [Stylonychia lemnae]
MGQVRWEDRLFDLSGNELHFEDFTQVKFNNEDIGDEFYIVLNYETIKNSKKFIEIIDKDNEKGVSIEENFCESDDQQHICTYNELASYSAQRANDVGLVKTGAKVLPQELVGNNFYSGKVLCCSN